MYIAEFLFYIVLLFILYLKLVDILDLAIKDENWSLLVIISLKVAYIQSEYFL